MEGVLQKISGGMLSGDFSPETDVFSEKEPPKIRWDLYFTTPLSAHKKMVRNAIGSWKSRIL